MSNTLPVEIDTSNIPIEEQVLFLLYIYISLYILIFITKQCFKRFSVEFLKKIYVRVKLRIKCIQNIHNFSRFFFYIYPFFIP